MLNVLRICASFLYTIPTLLADSLNWRFSLFMATKLRSKRRLAWLSSNIILNNIAAIAISAYEETLTAVIAIAVFLLMCPT